MALKKKKPTLFILIVPLKIQAFKVPFLGVDNLSAFQHQGFPVLVFWRQNETCLNKRSSSPPALEVLTVAAAGGYQGVGRPRINVRKMFAGRGRGHRQMTKHWWHTGQLRACLTSCLGIASSSSSNAIAEYAWCVCACVQKINYFTKRMIDLMIQ